MIVIAVGDDQIFQYSIRARLHYLGDNFLLINFCHALAVRLAPYVLKLEPTVHENFGVPHFDQITVRGLRAIVIDRLVFIRAVTMGVRFSVLGDFIVNIANLFRV